MGCENVYARIAELYPEYVTFWKDIVAIESPTENKAQVDKVGAFAAEKAKARGWEIEIHPEPVSGDVICITMNPEVQAAPICFSSHMDTVHPIGCFGDPCVRIDEAADQIFGPGVCDCKGGIAVAFLTMAALEDCGYKKRPLRLLLQSDEENSARNSQKRTIQYLYEKSRGCAAFLNGEPNGFRICRTRKGISKYCVDVYGKAVHSASCYDGASAIAAAAHKLLELETMKDKNGLTCNCGLISGGSAENTVPEHCRFTADVRFANEQQRLQADEMIRKVAAATHVPGTTAEVTLLSDRCAMEVTQANLDIFDRFNQILAQEGLQTYGYKHGDGGSDGANLTMMGLPVLDCVGVCGGKLHQLGEWARLSSLKTVAEQMAALAWYL